MQNIQMSVCGVFFGSLKVSKIDMIETVGFPCCCERVVFVPLVFVRNVR